MSLGEGESRRETVLTAFPFLSPANIVIKMDSAQADDKPRWGSMPEKKNLSYVVSRIREGVYVYPRMPQIGQAQFLEREK